MSIDVIIQNQGLAIGAFFLVSAILTGLAYFIRRRGYEPDLTIDILALFPAVFGVWGLFNELAVTRNLNHNFEVVSERFKLRTDYELAVAKLKIIETDLERAKEAAVACTERDGRLIFVNWNLICPPIIRYLRIDFTLDDNYTKSPSAQETWFRRIRPKIINQEGIEYVQTLVDLYQFQPKFLLMLFGARTSEEGLIFERSDISSFNEIDDLLRSVGETQDKLLNLREIREIDDEDPLFLILILLAISLEISKTVSRAIYDRRAG